ncbi:MAG: DUF349 domain-containing protein [Bacteroidales bacterium]|jgi:hypothetical protein|nr:DUF349 domain-containing protein [Bacteroidales bacterium]
MGDTGAFVPERRTEEKGLLMTTEDPKNSVHDEQFDADEKELESTGKETDKKTDEVLPADDAGVKPDEVTEVTADTAPEEETPAAAEEVTEETAPELAGEAEEAAPEEETPAAAEEVTEETAQEAIGEAEEEASEEEPAHQDGEDNVKPEDKDESVEKSGDEEQGEAGELSSTEEAGELPPVDYSGFSRKELVETLALIVENRPPAEITDDVARIKEFFYKKTKTEFNEARLNYAKEGGNIDDYRPEPDELEVRIKSILEVFRHRKSDFNRVQESEKQDNLRKKLEIIEQIKDLVNREEAINKTFQEFRNLQNEWHATGIVPQSALKDLWENYHHSVEIFYDYIKINRELRDLDLKKNLEAKIILCEKAEELLTEPNAITAFKLLQEYHDQWREIGPVPHENKNDVWERFREATSKINKRHHEYFETQKDEQRQNLEAKTALCEKVEEIAGSEILTFADFREKSDAIIEYQKQWRTLGFAPKKHNNKIYQRFRSACDSFFEKKRAFFAESKETQMHNLQLKTELCLKAEALQESTDWKDTSDMLIRLQKEWKEIGPVPRKYSEKIWKRFRKACDTFFTRKSEFIAGRDTSYEDNLQAKLALLDELEAFDPGDDDKAAFEKLREIQKNWMEIGYVPIDKKDEIARRYKDALNKQFDRLKLDDEDKNILRYRSKVDSARSNPRAARKVRAEREKFYSKIKQLENDIVLWENNIGFFAKSVNADNMIREVEEKIAEAKKNIKILEEKMKLIDSSIDE